MDKSNLDRINLQNLLDNSKYEFWKILHVNKADAHILNNLLYDPYIRVVDPSQNLIIFSFSLIKSGLRHDLKVYNFNFYSAFKAYINEWKNHTFDGNPELCAIRPALLSCLARLELKSNFYAYE